MSTFRSRLLVSKSLLYFAQPYLYRYITRRHSLLHEPKFYIISSEHKDSSLYSWGRDPFADGTYIWANARQNRKEGNDQESIQLSHTPIRDIKGKETQTRNNWTLMETSLAESQTDSYFPTKWPNGYPKQKDVSDTHIQRLTITKINHDRRTALERSVESISLGV